MLPFEFYDQVEVKTGGVSAEFGRATGGFVNAVTKSGSNDFKVGVNMYWSPDFLRTDGKSTFNTAFDPTQPGNAGPVTPRSANYLDETEGFEGNIWVSGPIIEDKLFFFLMLNENRDKQTDIALNNTFVEEFRSPTYGAKVDFYLTDTQHFEYTWFRDRITYETDIYGVTVGADGYQTGADFADFQGTQIQGNGGDNHIVKYSGEWTDWLNFSASYGHGENLQLNTTASENSFVFVDENGNRLTNYGTAIIEETNNSRDAYRIDVDINAEFFGEHQIRFGWDREDLEASFDDRYPGAQSYFLNLGANGASVRGAIPDPMNPGQYLLETRGGAVSPNYNTVTGRFRIRSRIASGAFTAENQAFYIQDAWSPTANLTLNLGLRAEKFENFNVFGDSYFDSGYNWQPRLGVNFDVFGDSTLQLSGSFGRYFLPVATNTSFRLVGNERDVRSNYIAGPGFDPNNLIGPNGQIQNATFTGTTSIFSDGFLGETPEAVSSNLKNQHVDEYIISLNHTVTDASPFYFGGLFEDWSFGLTATQRKLYDGFEDAAVDAAVLQYCADNGIVGCSATWTGFHHYVPGQPRR